MGQILLFGTIMGFSKYIRLQGPVMDINKIIKG
jgi:hypothetical protein